MDHKKELRIIKITLIIMPIGLIVGMAIDELIYSSKINSSLGMMDESSTKILSGFGGITLNDNNELRKTQFENELVYRDKNLGYEISRPNLKWSFVDTMQDPEINKVDLASKNFLGGLYVDTNNDKSFFVGVFDTTNYGSFSLPDYVDQQTDFMEKKFNSQITIHETSPTNNWAIFGIKSNSGKNPIYGEQLLQLHNNKLYMLQYTGLPPESIDDQKREEIRTIIDSFTLL